LISTSQVARIISMSHQCSPCKNIFIDKRIFMKSISHSHFNPERPLKKLTVLTPWIQDYCLQNCEKINIYLLSHPVCGITLANSNSGSGLSGPSQAFACLTLADIQGLSHETPSQIYRVQPLPNS
jgi:hypothetical protein